MIPCSLVGLPAVLTETSPSNSSLNPYSLIIVCLTGVGLGSVAGGVGLGSVVGVGASVGTAAGLDWDTGVLVALTGGVGLAVGDETILGVEVGPVDAGVSGWPTAVPPKSPPQASTALSEPGARTVLSSKN